MVPRQTLKGWRRLLNGCPSTQVSFPKMSANWPAEQKEQDTTWCSLSGWVLTQRRRVFPDTERQKLTGILSLACRWQMGPSADLTAAQCVWRGSVCGQAAMASSAPNSSMTSVVYVGVTAQDAYELWATSPRRGMKMILLSGRRRKKRGASLQIQIIRWYWQNKVCNVSAFCPINSKGYTDVVKIPAGSTHLKVRQHKAKDQTRYSAYLALRRPNGDYLLNGKFMISTSETIIPLNGSVLNYSGWSQRDEWLHSMGPGALQEALVVQILATDAKKPLDVRYSFFMPRRTTPQQPSVPLIPYPKPTTAHSTTTLSTMVRTTSSRTTSSSSPTFLASEPPIGLVMSTSSPGPQWVTGSWMTCSRTCDTGWQSRTVQCKNPDGKLSKGCVLSFRPSAFRPCLVKKCWGKRTATVHF